MNKINFIWKYWLVALGVVAVCACSKDAELAKMVNQLEHQEGTRTANWYTKKVTVDAIGTLKAKVEEAMEGEELNKLEKLVVSGPLAAADFDYLRNELSSLQSLDLKDATFNESDKSYWNPYWGGIYLQNNIVCNRMFYFWNSLKEIVLPSSVLYIDEYAFSQCSALESVVIPDKVKFIGKSAFNNCELLSFVECSPSSELDSIAGNAFYNSGLKSIRIPDNVRYIGDNAFNQCNSLISVTLPSSLEAIQDYVFANCDSLQSIVIPDKVKYIGYNAFAANVQFSKIEFSSTSELDSIASYAFQSSILKSINIPNGVTFIGDHAFYYCDSLTTVTLPADLTYLGDYAFNWCTSLESIEIPDGVKHIKQGTFYDCRSLRNIKLPAYLESIDTYGITASLIETLELPSTLKTISSYAFEHNDYIKKVVVPEGVETIGTQAFRYNRGLKELTIPSTVTSIERDFAYNCPELQALYWNAPLDVPYNYNTSNCFLYVETNQEIAVDASWNNVILNGVAQSPITIQASTNNEFKILKEFTAPEVIYTRYFDYWLETVPGKSSGWQTIVLPFTPDSIYHETKGQIAPFNSEIESAKPFWLRELTADGFVDVTSIEPDKAYIIAMPNNSAYLDDYNLDGTITFTAKNVTLGKTPDVLEPSVGPDFDFYPTYSFVKKALRIYALQSDSWGGLSRFTRSAGDIYPFNAYVTAKGGGRSSRTEFDLDTRSSATRGVPYKPNTTGIPQIGDM